MSLVIPNLNYSPNLSFLKKLLNVFCLCLFSAVSLSTLWSKLHQSFSISEIVSLSSLLLSFFSAEGFSHCIQNNLHEMKMWLSQFFVNLLFVLSPFLKWRPISHHVNGKHSIAGIPSPAYCVPLCLSTPPPETLAFFMLLFVPTHLFHCLLYLIFSCLFMIYGSVEFNISRNLS
jgi:hypothetical protein